MSVKPKDSDLAKVMRIALRGVSSPPMSYMSAVKAYWEQVYKAEVQRRLIDCLEGRDKVRL
jgi:hypothetical protein